MSHKITVICDHGDSGAGLVLAIVVAAALLIGSGAAATIGHALVVVLIVAGAVVAALAALGIVVAVLICRRRRARGIREGLSPALWRPVIAPPAPRRALAPARPARRPAAILARRELPRANPVIRGHAEPVNVPAARGGRHAQRPRA